MRVMALIALSIVVAVVATHPRILKLVVPLGDRTGAPGGSSEAGDQAGAVRAAGAGRGAVG